MREYVEKVTATMGDNGVNGKSAVAGQTIWAAHSVT